MSSQLFEREVKDQKSTWIFIPERSKEVYDFLKGIELEAFAEALVSNGFDELDLLADLTTEDLNVIMMRAHQQIRLLEAVKGLKAKLNIDDNKSAVK